jgi:hypothetical protein
VGPVLVLVQYCRWVVASVCLSVDQGEQVLDSYGPTFMEEEREERRLRLRKDYMFSCGCLACLRRWPCMTDLAISLFEVRSPEVLTKTGQVREIQLKVPRTETSVVAGLMEQ